MSTFEDSILRVMKDDSVIGAAFLVSDHLVATCAHVVKSAGAEIGETISLQLSNGKNIEATIEPEFWRDPDAEDVSILRLENQLENIQPVILGSSSGTKGHRFSTFGFPDMEQELAGGGKIIGQATISRIKVLQVRSPEVTPGFSGAPAFDEITKRVVGMIVAITPPDEFRRLGTTAFAIPSEMLSEICPELRVSDICPYRSLDVFSEDDEPYFFGREKVIRGLIDRLKQQPRFLAVLGPSGSGKSSVVRAGLIPALKRGEIPGSEKWGIITIRPANQPFDQLSSAGLINPQPGLEIAVKKWLADHQDKSRLALVVDQFEEVLVTTDVENRKKFIEDFSRLLDSSQITLIITLRDDFFGRFIQEATPLVEWLQKNQFIIPATLELDELRAIVSKPADKVGLSFEEGLVDTILDDANEADLTKSGIRSTILPLLEFALTQLWERRKDGKLTREAYKRIDGVTGSLAQWADRAYSQLNAEEKKLAKKIFSKLVYLGNEAEQIPDMRRVIPIHELEKEGDVLLIQNLISEMVTARLFSTSRDLATGGKLIEIIHDALLREWGQLRNWINDDRRFLTWRQKLNDRYQEWRNGTGDLLHRRELVEAQNFWSERKDDLIDLEDYIKKVKYKNNEFVCCCLAALWYFFFSWELQDCFLCDNRT